MGIKDRLLLSYAPFFASLAIRFLYLTNRTEILGGDHPQKIWDRGEKIILSSWHDQLLMMIMAYRGEGAKILISSSKDGELIARTMAYFGQGTVRGSSSRGGRAAFKQLLALGREDVDLGFTPDGPLGPRHELKEGIIQLARLSGRPIVPLAFVCSRGHRFNSWDRFLVPYPFGRGVYSFGQPLYFDRQEGADRFHQRLQSAMQENQQQAEKHLESYGLLAV
jgi:lysophospholipid acyltransferase (LPLAT)-like uncharacterized protein